MSNSMRTAAVLVTALSSFVARVASSTEIHVPGDHLSIQAAVSAAADGDTVVVANGVYPEAVVISGKSHVTLKGGSKTRIKPPAGPGIAVDASAFITIVKVIVEDGGSDGIVLTSVDDCTVKKCTVKNAAGAGVRAVKCLRTSIVKNRILHVGGHGIALSAGSENDTSDSTVTDNEIEDTGGDAIGVRGDRNLIAENEASDCGANGFAMELEPDVARTGNIFRDNSVERADGSGFVVCGTGNTFQSNLARKTGRDGLEVISGAVENVLTGNEVRRAGADGIFVDVGADKNELNANKIAKPSDDGIDLNSEQNLVDGNRITKAGDNGLEVDAGNNTMSSNKVKKSGNFDIQDSTVGGTNTYTDNQAKKTDGV